MNIGGASLHVNNLTEYLETNKSTTRFMTGTVSPWEGDMTYITKFNKDVRIVIPANGTSPIRVISCYKAWIEASSKQRYILWSDELLGGW